MFQGSTGAPACRAPKGQRQSSQAAAQQQRHLDGNQPLLPATNSCRTSHRGSPGSCSSARSSPPQRMLRGRRKPVPHQGPSTVVTIPEKQNSHAAKHKLLCLFPLQASRKESGRGRRGSHCRPHARVQKNHGRLAPRGSRAAACRDSRCPLAAPAASPGHDTVSARHPRGLCCIQFSPQGISQQKQITLRFLQPLVQPEPDLANPPHAVARAACQEEPRDMLC